MSAVAGAAGGWWLGSCAPALLSAAAQLQPRRLWQRESHTAPTEALHFCALLLHRYTLNCQCPEERWAEVQGAFRAAGSSFRIFSSGSGTQGYPDAL